MVDGIKLTLLMFTQLMEKFTTEMSLINPRQHARMSVYGNSPWWWGENKVTGGGGEAN